MTIGTKLVIKLFYKQVGEDYYGNRYYLAHNKAYRSGPNARAILYGKVKDASSVPPLWHAWLHYTIHRVPTKEDLQQYEWQKKRPHNMTGTNRAYNPADNLYLNHDYECWNPNQYDMN